MDESYHSALAAGIEKKYRQLELDIMEDIVRRVQKAGTITDTADWQIQRLVILGNSTQDIEDLISKAVDGNKEEVARLYKEVIAQEYTRDKSLYEQIGKEFIPYEQNAELQQITNALVDQSTEELYNITKSTGFMVDDGHGGKVFTPLSDIYNGYLDDAITGMANGAYDYNTLVRKLVGQMTASGLRSDYAFSDTGTDTGVQYASGWHNRIDVAARRALLTGFGQLTGKVVDMNAQRLGTNYFEVTWHAGARPEHAEWQGKVYTKEQLTTKCGLGTGPGLLGWNCRHTYYPFIPGVSERLYTDEWLEEQNARENTPVKFKGKEYTTYQATQKQRQMETALRARREQVDLLRKAGADKDDITIAQCKYQAALDEYKQFSKAMNLEEQTARIYTGRTKGRIAPSKQTYETHKYDEQIIHELHSEAGLRGKVHITPTQIDFDTLQYDETHIIKERDHGVTEAEARKIIKTASVSMTVWGGSFERYYSTQENGVAYVNMETNTVRTAYKGEQVYGDSAKAMEVLKKYGK